MFNGIVYLRKEGEVLALKKQKLFFWNPNNFKQQEIPLFATNLYSFKEGLIYIDLLGNMYLRKESFTEYELGLIDLYNDILE